MFYRKYRKDEDDDIANSFIAGAVAGMVGSLHLRSPTTILHNGATCWTILLHLIYSSKHHEMLHLTFIKIDSPRDAMWIRDGGYVYDINLCTKNDVFLAIKMSCDVVHN